MMIWEGIELIPVVSSNKKTVGVINRQDVLKSMQLLGRQPQMGETINDQITIYNNESRWNYSRSFTTFNQSLRNSK